MGATDKLIPTAIILGNNLKGIPFSTRSYRMPAKKASIHQNPYTYAIQFFASIYAKGNKVANRNEVWNHKLVDGSNSTALFTPTKNNHDLTLGMIVAISEEEWNELQIAISKSFNIVYPFDIAGPWTPAQITGYNNLMGVLDNGSTDPKDLLGADASLLGNFAQGLDWADAWNTIKVPYDLTIGVDTPFIAPIFKPTGATKFYYRYTGLRRWFGFEGYDLV